MRDKIWHGLSSSPPLSRDELDAIEKKSAAFAMAELARLSRLPREFNLSKEDREKLNSKPPCSE